MDKIALIVEDDAGLRLIYRHVLEDIGYKVLEARDGAVAIDILEEQTPHIIFLDIRLPQVNGLDVLDHIATIEHLHGCKVVVASSASDTAEYAMGMRPNVTFIVKPIRPDQIRQLAAL